MSKTVSILTPTYDERCNFLQFVARGICQQTYKNIKEWVIVDGTKKGVSCLPAIITKLRTLKNIPEIIFIEQDIKRKNTIGNLRNIVKNKATGDILIHFDDDDFYPFCRIKHAVEQLTVTGREIAGNSDLYMFDVHFDTLYQFRSFGPNHVLGGTMAYTKKYALEHTFDESVTHAEEGSFTNKFTEPLALLKADKSIIASSHGNNTYSKKKIIWDNLYCATQNPKKQTMFYRSKTLKSVSKNKKYIKDYLKVIRSSLVKNEQNFDITFFYGGERIDSKYIQYNIFHNQAVYLKSKGYSVEIYSYDLEFKDNKIIDGVTYKYYCQFNIKKPYNIFIILNLTAAKLFFMNNIKVKTKKTILYSPCASSGTDIYKTYLDDIETVVIDNKVIDSILLHNAKFKDYELKDWNKKTKIIQGPFPISKNINNYSKINNSFYMCIYHPSCIIPAKKYLMEIFPEAYKHNKSISVHIYNFELMEKYLHAEHGTCLEEIISKDYYTIHRVETYTELMQEKYQYQYHLQLYNTVEVNPATISDLRHSLRANCIPIINSTTFQMLSRFRCFIYTGSFDVDARMKLIVQLCYRVKDWEMVKIHNQGIFEKNDFLKNWGDEFLKLIM